MSRIIHPNLVRAYTVIIPNNKAYIIMPLMLYGDLKSILKYKYLRALFNQNEYEIKFFVEILEKYIKKLDYIFSFFPFDDNWMEDLIKCFKKKNFFKDEFTIKIHEALYNLNKKIRFEEGILYIKNSLVLRGVLDEYGKLNSGYIFVKIAPNNILCIL